MPILEKRVRGLVEFVERVETLVAEHRLQPEFRGHVAVRLPSLRAFHFGA